MQNVSYVSYPHDRPHQLYYGYHSCLSLWTSCIIVKPINFSNFSNFSKSTLVTLVNFSNLVNHIPIWFPTLPFPSPHQHMDGAPPQELDLDEHRGGFSLPWRVHQQKKQGVHERKIGWNQQKWPLFSSDRNGALNKRHDGLVVSIPLKNMSSSLGAAIPNIWKNNPFMFQTNKHDGFKQEKYGSFNQQKLGV